MVAAMLLLAAGCVTATPGARERQPGTPRSSSRDGEPDVRLVEANERCDSMREREYTPALRSAGIEGVTLVWMLVDERGMVGKVQLRESSGHAELDEIALRVARCRRFMPALHRGEPVRVWLALPFTFRADSPRT